MENIDSQQLINFGIIGMQCHGKVLALDSSAGSLAFAISIFGNDVYGLDDNQESYLMAIRINKAIGLNCKFYDDIKCLKSFANYTFDTVVFGFDNAALGDIELDTKIKRGIDLCKRDGRIIILCHLANRSQLGIVERKFKLYSFKIEWNLITRGGNGIGCIELSENFLNCNRSTRSTSDIEQHDLCTGLDTSEKVSVIIPTYNRGSLIQRCLNSVLKQTYNNTEIIVVNDGSTDNTDEALKPFLAKIRYFKKVNGGKSTAINLGLNHATGKYVWIFDDDDVALPRKLEMDIHTFQRNPDIDIIHSFGYRVDEATGKIISIYRSRIAHSEETILRLLEWPQILNITMITKRECYDKVGCYREDLIRCQDYEMWFRLARNFRIQLLPYSTVLIGIHSGIRGTKDQKVFSANDSMFYEKKIFSEIYEKFSLQDYLPALKENPDDPYLQANSLLERARIMGIHELYDLVMRDFMNIAELVRQTGINISKAFLEKMLNTYQYAILKDIPNFKSILQLMQCLRKVSAFAENGLEVTAYTARRFYWSFSSQIKSFKLTQGAHMCLMSLWFFGLLLKRKVQMKVTYDAAI